MEKRRVRLTINGVVCGLITGESEAYMQSLADEVGGLMKQIMDSSPLITREAAALTAALSICDDCHKNADRAAALAGRNEELEVEAELWQEEKVELLKSAVDTQKDAQLAEKAARLEAENARLRETAALLEEAQQAGEALRTENEALRQAAQQPDAQAQALAQENASLQENLNKLSETVRQNSDSLKLAETRLAERQRENQGLRDRLEQMAQALKEAQAAQPQAPASRHGSKNRKNPLRSEEGPMEQEGLQSFFAVEENPL